METAPQPPVVSVRNLVLSPDGQTLLSQVFFDIRPGEFVYLTGKTGSGKSSLLRVLYADLSCQSGQAEVAGHKLAGIAQKEIPVLRRKLGIVFQDFELLMDRSVWENLLFVMKATGWKDKHKMAARAGEVLQQVGMDGHAAKMPHQLSGGEQQRVAIARALLNTPAVLLADEPTGNLDPAVAYGILELFMDICRQGTAVLMATHHHNFLKRFPARVLHCGNGTVNDISKERVARQVEEGNSGGNMPG